MYLSQNFAVKQKTEKSCYFSGKKLAFFLHKFNYKIFFKSFFIYFLNDIFMCRLEQ